MSVNWEKKEGNQGVLTVEVDVETVNKGLEASFKKMVKKVNIPGFRKGKIPRPMFEKRFGVESLYADAVDFMLPEAYAEAVDKAGIFPVDQPEIDVVQIEKGKPFIFTAAVTVKPEVKLGEYKGLEVEKVETEVTEEDIDNELKTLQEKYAELILKEGEKAEEGDTVVIDFEGFVDGEAFEGGKAENYTIVLGSNNFIPGFEEQMIGMEAGGEKDIEVSFPEEYHAAELAGKPATFKVKVHEVKTKELPALDDEFAKDVDEEAESLDELKESIRKRLKESKEHEAKHKTEDTVIEKATDNAEIDLPEVMVKNEVERMVQEFVQRLSMQGMNLELYTQYSGQDEAALRAQMEPEAEKRVRMNLTLEAIAQKENLEPTEEELHEELEKMASMYQMQVDEIKKALGNLDGIQTDLKVRKAIDFLVQNSKIVA